MKILALLLGVVFCAGCACRATVRAEEKTDVSFVQIATNRKPAMQIVLVDHPTVDEQHAAAELAAYLKKITGGTFPVVGESAYTSGNSIQVGNTAKARANGLDSAGFASEQWQVTVRETDIYLNGGRPRGALYAVYHFLEDQCRVRWWSPWEEHVPVAPNLSVSAVATTGKPAFAHREITYWDGRVGMRNRLSGRPTPPEIAPAPLEYAVPKGANFVHSNGFYINPDRYFDQHPEWFAADANGNRQRNGQLCLSNLEMRHEYLANLLAGIAEVKQAAAAAGKPPALVFDISQTDNKPHCECAVCDALAKEQGAQSGPIIEFSNWMATQIAVHHPDVTLSTLAYMYSEVAPATLAPQSNLTIRLCDTLSNYLLPIVAPENAVFKGKFDGWAAKASASGLHIWKYIRTYSRFGSAPLPNLRALREDFNYYLANGVVYIMCEHESFSAPDMWDYKNWMLAKLMEYPSTDFDALRADYCHGYYGAAGDRIIAYLDLMERQAAGTRSHCDWLTAPEQLAYLNQDFYDQAQKLFDEAVAAAAGDPAILRRVKQARLPLDRSQVYLIRSEKVIGDKAALAARYREAWHDRIEMTASPAQWPLAKFKVNADCDWMTGTDTYVPRPAGIPGVAATDTVLGMHAAAGVYLPYVVQDGEAPSGFANKLILSDFENAKYAMPMPLGYYSPVGKIESHISASDIPGRGYHWYKIGESRIYAENEMVDGHPGGGYIWASWPWRLQIPLGGLLDEKHPEQVYEMWVSLKFEGAKFLGDDSREEANAVYLECTALVRK